MGYSFKLKRGVTASKKTDVNNHKALLNGIAAKYAQYAKKLSPEHRETHKGCERNKADEAWGNTASVQLLEEYWNARLEFRSKKKRLHVEFNTGSPDVAMIYRPCRRRKT